MNNTIIYVILFLLFLAAVTIIVTSFLYKYLLKKQEEEYIETISGKSKKLNKLQELNEKYLPMFNMDFTEDLAKSIFCKNKFQLDRFDYDVHAKAYISDRNEFIKIFIKEVNQNRTIWNDYTNEIKQLPAFLSKEEAEYLQIPFDFCRNKEKELFIENIIKVNLKPNLIIEKNYSSPQRRNIYNPSLPFSFEEIVDMYNENIENKKFKLTAKYQRSKMNKKIRFDVLHRDGFKCKYCGRGQIDGVKLHVDHIKPVSKGGLTVMSNLQTLCEECNLGKSDYYDFDSLD